MATSQNITTVAGTGISGDGPDGVLATTSQLKAVFGVTADTCGNIYIADGHSWRIRKVSFNPTCEPLNITSPTPLTFTLSPNPVTSQLTVTSSGKLAGLQLTNMLGAIVVRGAGNGSERVVVDLSELPAGVYFLTVYDVDGNKRTEKVVKE